MSTVQPLAGGVGIADSLAPCSTAAISSTVPELFERQAERTPDAIALVHGRSQLTYAETNRRSTVVARALIALGVQPETFVAIHAAPSVDGPVAALAVLKAGAAYVTLPRGYPEARLHEMQQRTGVSVVLAAGDVHESVTMRGVTRLSVAELMRAAGPSNSETLPPRATVESAAFVRFTSGSTGIPKGVVRTHRCLVSRVSAGLLVDIRANDVCGLMATQGYGPRLFSPLMIGARVVLLGEEETMSPSQLAEAVARHRITSLFVVPTLLRQLLDLDARGLDRLQSLRVVTAGGESLTPDLVRRFHAALPHALLVNSYGSNELGGPATTQVIEPGQVPECSSIGRPVPDTRVYLLDKQLLPVPDGERGEICVSSPNLAHGYLDDPELTARVFLPDPFAAEPGARLFRTGDLGRLLPNGEIEFVGRADHQVKVHGHRIELEEVESALLALPGVREAAVTTEIDGDECRLVAYVTPVAGAWLSVHAIREGLSARLPPYMVPAAFMTIEALPLTPTGKIDRRALRQADAQRLASDAPYQAPRGETETAIHAAWCEVLGLERVSVDDHFLDVGGDSLRAAQVMVRLSEQFDLEPSVPFVYERPTIAEQADGVAAARQAADAVLALATETSRPSPRDDFDQAADTGVAIAISPAPMEVPVRIDRKYQAAGRSRRLNGRDPQSFLNGGDMFGGTSFKSVLDTLSTILVMLAAGALLWTLLGPKPVPPGRRPRVEPVSGASISPNAVRHARGIGEVVLVEFADYECPFCARHAKNTAPAIKEELIDAGELQHVFFNFPLDIHPHAQKAGEAAECAARQGRFWEMHERLFDSPTALTSDDLLAKAERAGLDRSQFRQCLEEGVTAQTVRDDLAEGRRLGVRATPAFFVGIRQPDGRITLERRINGAVPLDTFKETVRELRPDRQTSGAQSVSSLNRPPDNSSEHLGSGGRERQTEVDDLTDEVGRPPRGS